MMRIVRVRDKRQLGMVGIDFQIGEKRGLLLGLWLPPWARQSRILRRSRQCFGFVTFQNPPLSGGVVLVENAQIDGLLAVRASPAPCLKRTCPFDFRLLIEIVGVKDQRLSSRIEDSAIRLLGFAGPRHVIYFRDVKIAGTHQFPNIAIMGEKFIALPKRLPVALAAAA